MPSALGLVVGPIGYRPSHGFFIIFSINNIISISIPLLTNTKNTFVFTGLNAQKLQLNGWMYDVYFKVWIVENKSLDPKKIGIPKNKILAAR